MNLDFAKEVRIENSTYCNYKCVFCPHSTKNFTRTKQIMSNEMFEKILLKIREEAPFIENCTISGFGEPFTDPGILEKIYISKALGFKTRVLTNASLLSARKLITLFSLKTDSIRMSIHTANKEDYCKITRSKPETFQEVMEAASIAMKLRENPEYNTEIIVSATVGHNDPESAVQSLKEKFDGKVDLLEIWKAHNWTNWADFRKFQIIKSTCGRPQHGPLQIQVDGTVNMCCFDYNGELLLGDFKTQTLDDIFSSKEYKEILKHHTEGTIPESNLICKHCDQLMEPRGILLYSSKYKEEERVGRVSTTYRSVEE